MGRYTGPKGRINRRLGSLIYEDNGSAKAVEKRQGPPGPQVRRRKVSTYGQALTEKQKIKHYYGLREKQLRKYFEMAKRLKGNTGQQLLVLCERRLDNVIRRAGFAVTRPQSRQGASHAHFQVNGRTVNIPSILVREGDTVSVRKRPNLQRMYKDIIAGSATGRCDWISFDEESLEAKVLSIPTFDDVSLPVDVGQVVAFLSR